MTFSSDAMKNPINRTPNSSGGGASHGKRGSVELGKRQSHSAGTSGIAVSYHLFLRAVEKMLFSVFSF